MRSLTVLFAALLLLGGCESSSGPADPTNPELHEFLKGLADWVNPTAQTTTVQSAPENLFFDADPENPDWRCDVTVEKLSTAENLLFVGEQDDFLSLWPGAVLHGDGLADANFDVISVDRAPVTVVTNLVVSPRAETVENPTGAAVQDAIARLVAPAGSNYQSRWTFAIDEVFSDQHGALSMTGSLGYAGQLAATLGVGLDRRVTTHFVFGRAVEEMYRVQFDTEALRSPAELFGESVTPSDLQKLGVGDENLPVYVKSVVYGRMMIFSARVETVVENTSFLADFEALFNQVSGGGSGTVDDLDLLENATRKAKGYGGDPATAAQAIDQLDFSLFFAPTDVAKAVPLYVEVVTVKEGAPAMIGDDVQYEVWSNCQGAIAYDLDLEFRRIKANRLVNDVRTYHVSLIYGLAGVEKRMLHGPARPGTSWVLVGRSVQGSINTNPLQLITVAGGMGAVSTDADQFTYPFASWPRDQPKAGTVAVEFQQLEGFPPALVDVVVTMEYRLEIAPRF